MPNGGLPNFDAIVFDFDGVIVESVDVKTQAFAALYADEGPAVVEQVVAWHLRHGGVSRFEKFRHYQTAILGRAPLSAAEEQALGERFAALVVEEVVKANWVPGAREALERLAGRVPLFVASGTPEQELLDIVRRRGIADRFVSVHGSPAKKGDILKTLAARYGFEPHRVLMVGDATTDMDGARAAGTAFLGRVPAGAVSPFPPEVQAVTNLTPLCHHPLHALPGLPLLPAAV